MVAHRVHFLIFQILADGRLMIVSQWHRITPHRNMAAKPLSSTITEQLVLVKNRLTIMSMFGVPFGARLWPLRGRCHLP